MVSAKRLYNPPKFYLKKKKICLLHGAELTSAILFLQVNDWQNDWVTFFAKQRIQPQMDMIEKNSGDREARELWAQLQVGEVLLVLIVVIARYQLFRFSFHKTKFLFVGMLQVLLVRDSSF